MRKISPFILLVLALIGCNNSNEIDIPVFQEPVPAVQSMPEEMPEDFGFSVRFGIEKKNEINTFEGKVVKDLIVDGTATAEVTLSNEELSEVYKKMKKVDILEEKHFIPEPVDGSMCVQQPHSEDEWSITLNGETIVHFISGEYCEPTEDAKRFLTLRNDVFDKVKNKDAYLELPEPTGGYH